jgi:hypothetical protein
MAIDVVCKNCDFFNELNPGVDNSGQCRRMPPRGIDDKSLPTGTDPVNVFPLIDDGSTEFCGQFKLSTTYTP